MQIKIMLLITLFLSQALNANPEKDGLLIDSFDQTQWDHQKNEIINQAAIAYESSFEESYTYDQSKNCLTLFYNGKKSQTIKDPDIITLRHYMKFEHKRNIPNTTQQILQALESSPKPQKLLLQKIADHTSKFPYPLTNSDRQELNKLKSTALQTYIKERTKTKEGENKFMAWWLSQ